MHVCLSTSVTGQLLPSFSPHTSFSLALAAWYCACVLQASLMPILTCLAPSRLCPHTSCQVALEHMALVLRTHVLQANLTATLICLAPPTRVYRSFSAHAAGAARAFAARKQRPLQLTCLLLPSLVPLTSCQVALERMALVLRTGQDIPSSRPKNALQPYEATAARAQLLHSTSPRKAASGSGHGGGSTAAALHGLHRRSSGSNAATASSGSRPPSFGGRGGTPAEARKSATGPLRKLLEPPAAPLVADGCPQSLEAKQAEALLLHQHQHQQHQHLRPLSDGATGAAGARAHIQVSAF